MFFIGNHPPRSSFNVYGKRHACEQSPRLAYALFAHEKCSTDPNRPRTVPMNKEFNGRVRSLVNRADLIRFSSRASTICVKPTSERNFAFQLYECRTAYWRAVQSAEYQFQNPHILNNQRIDTGLVEVIISRCAGSSSSSCKMVLSVTKFLHHNDGQTAPARQYLSGYTGIMTGTKTRAADINSIGTGKIASRAMAASRAGLNSSSREKIRSHSYPVAEKWRLF